MLSERKGIEHDAARGVLLPFRYRGPPGWDADDAPDDETGGNEDAR